MTLHPAWRIRAWTWVLPLVFAIAGAVVLVIHPGRTGAGFAEMEKVLSAESGALTELAGKEARLESVLENARASREALQVLYGDRLATQSERLTQLITEVKRLAQRAGLEPAAISYPEESIDEYGLVRMSLVFDVQGTYAQFRSLINLIELSDLFLVIDRVAVRDSSGASALGISLQISTFFVQDARSLALRGGSSGAPRARATEPRTRRPTRAADASRAPGPAPVRRSVGS